MGVMPRWRHSCTEILEGLGGIWSGKKLYYVALKYLSIIEHWDYRINEKIYPNMAIRELKKNAGTQFDQEIVELLLELIEEIEVGQV
ncbi:hypothetical protein K9M78_01470 [Candidatus Bipolaricaulota bacterium]|nr:hypothetical protein [Candidatus Bipolaricaulota bacterium]